MNAAQGRKNKKRKHPYIAKKNGDPGVTKMPNIGDHRFENYDMIESLFVDNSGCGADSEPALTLDQFLCKVEKGLGYAIISEGQFQIDVGVFKKC